MSQREVLIVLAHAMGCTACRQRLLERPNTVFSGRALSPAEKEGIARLKESDFVTPELLARAAGVQVEELQEYRDHPVARLRHF